MFAGPLEVVSTEAQVFGSVRNFIALARNCASSGLRRTFSNSDGLRRSASESSEAKTKPPAAKRRYRGAKSPDENASSSVNQL